jgi:hypothetical protein
MARILRCSFFGLPRSGRPIRASPPRNLKRRNAGSMVAELVVATRRAPRRTSLPGGEGRKSQFSLDHRLADHGARRTPPEIIGRARDGETTSLMDLHSARADAGGKRYGLARLENDGTAILAVAASSAMRDILISTKSDFASAQRRGNLKNLPRRRARIKSHRFYRAALTGECCTSNSLPS